jgi:hypothetical protein
MTVVSELAFEGNIGHVVIAPLASSARSLGGL